MFESLSLSADGIKIGGDLVLDRKFVSSGTISLRSADIGGTLSCGGARLEGTNEGDSMAADGIKIGGDMFLNQGFWSAAAIRLIGAEITGELNCSGATLADAGASDAALIADGVKVGDDVFLDQGFTPVGAVKLPGADITGELTMRGARLIRPNRDGVALLAEGIKVGGDIFLERPVQGDDPDTFLSTGTVSLKDAQVGRSLSLYRAVLDVPADKTALDADGAQITGTFHWRPAKPVHGRVSVKGASASELDDDWRNKRDNAYWPKDLRLDGFSYTTISAAGKTKVKRRLKWIRGEEKGWTWTWRRGRQVNRAVFASGPYQQLFGIYQRSGNDADARRVAIAQRRDHRRFGNLPWDGRCAPSAFHGRPRTAACSGFDVSR